jgi:hypothetical protein
LKIKNAIEKTLSRNDTGETGSHQAGIAIPKETEILSFFPELDKKIKNPRIRMNYKDSNERDWDFSFIYYNNKFFGGTRNEYRLSGTTGFIKNYALKEGDKITLLKYENDYYSIFFTKNYSPATSEEILILGNSWRTVSIKRSSKN